MSRIRLHTDDFETNGKEYHIKSFSKRQNSSAITLDIVENAWTTRSIVVPESEVEWLDEK